MRITGIVILVALSACVHYQATGGVSSGGGRPADKVRHISELPTTREDALHVLQTTEQFEDTAIGEGGRPSAEVFSFVRLLNEPDAVQVFHSLLDQAHVAGQLYALAGLYLLDHDLYATQIGRYKTNDTWVSTMFGCIISAMKVSDIVRASDGRDLDIDRGGYPKRFAEFKRCSK